MTKGGNQACILCSAVLALISCPKCRAAVCTIHLLRNATVESFLLEHKCAYEKLEISLHDTPAFMQKCSYRLKYRTQLNASVEQSARCFSYVDIFPSFSLW